MGNLLKNLLILTCWACVLASKPAPGSIEKLGTEFLRNNYGLFELDRQVDLAVLNLESDRASRSWLGNFSGSYTNDQLDGLTVFSVTGTQANIYSLGVSRQFDWGNKFEIINSFERYEGTFFPETTYGFAQTVSMSQSLGANFLGRNTRLNQKILGEEIESKKSFKRYQSETLFLQFVLDYSKAAVNKELVDLKLQAVARAKKRLKLVRKLTRDGLRLKTDLYRVELALIQAQESHKQSQVDFSLALENLSNHLHRKTETSEINALSRRPLARPKGSLETNPEYELLKQEMSVIQKKLRQSDQTIAPEIDLSASYKTNAYDFQRGTAFDEGGLFGDTDELKVSLGVSLPIGFEPQRNQQQQVNIQKMLKQRQFEVAHAQYQQKQMRLEERLELNEKNIRLAKRRKGIANKSLNEINRLYNRGKADLDSVIRSEEDLINTQISLSNYLLQNRQIVYQLASLFGSLRGYVVGEIVESASNSGDYTHAANLKPGDKKESNK